MSSIWYLSGLKHYKLPCDKVSRVILYQKSRHEALCSYELAFLQILLPPKNLISKLMIEASRLDQSVSASHWCQYISLACEFKTSKQKPIRYRSSTSFTLKIHIDINMVSIHSELNSRASHLSWKLMCSCESYKVINPILKCSRVHNRSLTLWFK